MISQKKLTTNAHIIKVLLILLIFIATVCLLATCGGSDSGSKTTEQPQELIDLPANVAMGPWLVYGEVPGSMFIRVGLIEGGACDYDTKYSDGEVTVTSPDNTFNKTFKLEQTFRHNFNDLHTQCWSLMEAHLTDLPQGTYDSLNYKITHSSFMNTEIKSSFSMPSPETNNFVFFAFGDNRRHCGSPEDFLPEVEDSMRSSIETSHAFSFLIHVGDYSAIGQFTSILCAARDTGWGHEYLKSSTENSMWESHTVLRSMLPTIGTAGNHEGKHRIGQETYHPPDFWLYDLLMGDQSGTGTPCSDDYTSSKCMISYDGNLYPAAYKVDWGILRIISINTYSVVTATDAYHVKNWLSKMIEGRKDDGKPTILVLHPPLFMRKTKDVGEVGSDYWKTQEDLEADIHGTIWDNEKQRSLVTLVLTGHVHATGRTKSLGGLDKNGNPIPYKNGVTYYIIGGGGAPDLDQPEDLKNDNMACLSKYNLNSTCSKYWYTGPQYQTDGLAYAKFEVNGDQKTIKSTIFNLDYQVIDEYEMPF